MRELLCAAMLVASTAHAEDRSMEGRDWGVGGVAQFFSGFAP